MRNGKDNMMRRTIIATSAAALLALSAACGTDDGGVDVDGATDAVATEVDNLIDGAEDAADDAASGANGTAAEDAPEGDDATGPGAEDTDGQDGTDAGADGETGTLTLADGSEVEVPAGIAQKHEEIQGATGHLGDPVGEPEEVADGHMLEFEGGTLVQNPDGEAFLVQGVILEEYMAGDGPEGELGFPTTDETPTETGFISTFAGGEITFDLATEQATVQQN